MGNQGNIGMGKGIWEGYLLAMVWEPNQMEMSIFLESRPAAWRLGGDGNGDDVTRFNQHSQDGVSRRVGRHWQRS